MGINDYLDLYLIAEKLGDKAWQQEIIRKLHNFKEEENVVQEPSTMINKLQEEYNMITEEMFVLNRQLRTNKSSVELRKIMWDIHQKRLSLSRKIYNEKSKLEHYNY